MTTSFLNLFLINRFFTSIHTNRKKNNIPMIVKLWLLRPGHVRWHLVNKMLQQGFWQSTGWRYMLLAQGVVPLLTLLTLHTLDRYYMYYSIVVLKNFKEFGQFRLNLPIKISYLIFLILKFLIQGFKSYGQKKFFF